MSAADLFLGAGVLLAAPTPRTAEELNSITVSPGLPGLFAAFVLAVLVVLLGVSMTRHTRLIQAQAKVKERIGSRGARGGQCGRGAEHGRRCG